MDSKSKRVARTAAPEEREASAQPSEALSAERRAPAVTADIGASEEMRRSATLLPSPPAPAGRAQSADFSEAAREALVASQSAASRGLAALNAACAAYVSHSVDIAARGAIDLLAAKTWSDAMAVNANLARAGFAEWLDGSAKLSEAGIELALESAKPFLTQFGKTRASANPPRQG